MKYALIQVSYTIDGGTHVGYGIRYAEDSALSFEDLAVSPMAVDSNRFFGGNLQIILKAKHGFASVATVVELLVRGVSVITFPSAVGVLAISLLHSVHIDFAEVVEKRDDNCRLLGRLNFRICGKQPYELFVNIQRMLKKSAGIRAMESCTCGSIEEIARLQPP